MPAAVRTTCPYCGVGCGVLATPDGRGGLAVAGDPDHPANRGRLCSKGAALGETAGLGERLLHPEIDGRRASWDAALGLVADRFGETIAAHGPDSVAIYASGQMLTEDYYVANKLMKGLVGSANIDTNSRLCMASTVAAHKRTLGADTVPGVYEDLEEADLVVLVGSNLAWCHPVLHQRLMAARERRGTRVVVVDPRRTATAEASDLHLAIRPGDDVALFAALLAEIDARGATDARFVRDHVEGHDDAVAAARGAAPDLPRADLAAFLDLWIGTERVVTVFSQGVNQAEDGTDRVSAIIACHLATGRIGRPGMGPFSVTGQPNAMGGREVGGLANQLACHLDLEDARHREAVQRFWGVARVPSRPGLKAVDLFRAVGDGRVRALWIVATNPAVSMPEADMVRDAIAACPFVVVSDVTRSDTARLARVVLPAAAWGEKDGTVTNSERVISRQRAVLPLPGEARPDWAILAEVGRRMGGAFDHASPAAVFREHAALSGVAASVGGDFDVSGLAGLTDAGYDALAPVRWPVRAPGTSAGRLFGDGRFPTPSGRARMPALRPRARDDTGRGPGTAREAQPGGAAAGEGLRLNTGRVRDHWHTMTRTGLSPRLSAHYGEPFLEIHPADAVRAGLAPADVAVVEGPHGRALLRALVTDRVAPGAVFAPMHWGARHAAAGRVDALVPARTDPVSGQPALKAATVRVSRLAAAWHGFAVSRREPRPATAYWALARTEAGWRCEMAGMALPEDWEAFARALFDLPDAPAATVHDPARGGARVALLEGGTVAAALLVSEGPVAASREHLSRALGGSALAALAGRPGADRPDPGPLVCACMGVGANDILAAARAGGATAAGTSCGSCRPEVAALLARAPQPVAAE
jgi:assimilatory nitrate reductase catalytic subunit